MTYLPTRYLISLIFAMGLIVTLIITDVLVERPKKKSQRALKMSAIPVLALFATINVRNYVVSLENRTYSMMEINRYLSAYDFGKQPIIGPWAPALSWKSEAMTYPVWKGFFNSQNVVEKHHPAIIISEIDEEDSGSAYLSEGIDIDSYADSIKYFTIQRWELKLLWLNAPETSEN